MLAVKRKKKRTHRKNVVILMPVSSVWLTTSLIPGEGQIKQQEVQKSFLMTQELAFVSPPFYIFHILPRFILYLKSRRLVLHCRSERE